jgi:hypothetical protein
VLSVGRQWITVCVLSAEGTEYEFYQDHLGSLKMALLQRRNA